MRIRRGCCVKTVNRRIDVATLSGHTSPVCALSHIVYFSLCAGCWRIRVSAFAAHGPTRPGAKCACYTRCADTIFQFLLFFPFLVSWRWGFHERFVGHDAARLSVSIPCALLCSRWRKRKLSLFRSHFIRFYCRFMCFYDAAHVYRGH